MNKYTMNGYEDCHIDCPMMIDGQCTCPKVGSVETTLTSLSGKINQTNEEEIVKKKRKEPTAGSQNLLYIRNDGLLYVQTKDLPAKTSIDTIITIMKKDVDITGTLVDILKRGVILTNWRIQT